MKISVRLGIAGFSKDGSTDCDTIWHTNQCVVNSANVYQTTFDD